MIFVVYTYNLFKCQLGPLLGAFFRAQESRVMLNCHQGFLAWALGSFFGDIAPAVLPAKSCNTTLHYAEGQIAIRSRRGSPDGVAEVGAVQDQS